MKNQWPSKSILWQKLSQTGRLLMFIPHRLGVLKTFSWFVSCSVNYTFFFPCAYVHRSATVVNTSLKGIKCRDPDLRSFQYIQKDRRKLNHKLEGFFVTMFPQIWFRFSQTNKGLTYARTKYTQTTHTQMCIQMCIHVYTPCIHTGIHVHTYSHLHTHIYTLPICKHTYLHTYTHIHTDVN